MLIPESSFEPVIKWSGSKRPVAPFLARLFPAAERYFEPFVGGGAMLPFRPCRVGFAGDVMPELIALWTAIRDEPDAVSRGYESRWQRLQSEGHMAFYSIRDDFNRERGTHDFLFLTRTCVNGLIRFNGDGNFNNSLHHTRPGIAPQRLREIIGRWTLALQKVVFATADYRETLSTVKRGDFVFLDPPYAGTRGRYRRESFEVGSFFDELERLNRIRAKWVVTFDGTAGGRSYDTSLPAALFHTRLPLPTGNSPFTKLMRAGVDAVVESVYLNFEPPAEHTSRLPQNREQKIRARATGDVEQRCLFA